ncbi:MAG: hypothetical protein JO006_15400 [Paucibacter sp.]|nr:hypothetical protein [Roseateles sp.]
MRKAFVTGLLTTALFTASLVMPAPAVASDWPMVGGDFWEITGVHVKDGGEFAYAKFLASEWKASQEFAKSKGWIKGYSVFANAYPRKGEPELYLVVILDRLATGPESEKRNDEFVAWKKKTTAQLEKESGDRLEIREIQSGLLLQEMKFK